MKSLHIIPTLDPIYGGPVNALEGLALSLARAGVEVEILTAYRHKKEDLSVTQRLEASDITLTRVGPVRTPIDYHPKLKATALQAVSRNEIIHIHGLWEDIQHRAARSAPSLNKPYIIRPCGMLDPWSLSQSAKRKRLYLAWRLRKNLNRATNLHFTAKTERDLTKPLNLQSPSIIEPNGLDLDAFQPPPEPRSFRKSNPELGNRPFVLFLSRIHPKKGLDLLIPAFAKAAPTNHALVIAGPNDHSYAASIKRLADEQGLSDRVIFPGMLKGEAKIAAYTEAELFALSSYQENFGIVIIEALACGTPVLTTNQVNIADQLESQPFADICETNVESVSQRLAEIFSKQRDKQAISEAARRYAINQFDWNAIAARWKDHYQSMIDR